MSAPKENPQYRRANFEDVVFVTRLVKEFYAKREQIYGINYDHESMLITVDETIRRGICILGPNSCAGARLALFPSNCNVVMASVLFWYFRAHREMTIFQALARECLKEGATHIDASSHWPGNTIGRLYEKLGMHAAELQYVGTLENCCKERNKAVMAKTVKLEHQTVAED